MPVCLTRKSGATGTGTCGRTARATGASAGFVTVATWFGTATGASGSGAAVGSGSGAGSASGCDSDATSGDEAISGSASPWIRPQCRPSARCIPPSARCRQ